MTNLTNHLKCLSILLWSIIWRASVLGKLKACKSVKHKLQQTKHNFNRIATVLPMIVPDEPKCGIKSRKWTMSSVTWHWSTRMLYKDITSQVTVSGHPTNKINIQRSAQQGFPFSMILFVLSTIPLINMIKANKIITGHISKYVYPVKVQLRMWQSDNFIAYLMKLNMSMKFMKFMISMLRPLKLPVT